MDDEVQINPKVVAWFAGRKISKETLIVTKTYSGKRGLNGEVEAATDGDLIVFPYIFEGKIVNNKYRDAAKRFSQIKGGRKVFWNGDVIADPMVQAGEGPLVITEGEIDALSFIEAGYPFVVSVPDGAPPPSRASIGDLPLPDDDKAYAYVLAALDNLLSLDDIIIATDDDPPGHRLAEELVARLGRIRCRRAIYPRNCKDANEVLCKMGKEAVTQLIDTAKEYKLSGVYQYSDLPKEPDLIPISTGWSRLDQYIRVCYPGLLIVTGIANSGKSTWANQMVAHLALQHNWTIGIASFEMRIDPFVTNTLKRTFKLKYGPDAERYKQWINDKFLFVAPEPDSEYDVEWLIERAIWAVQKKRIRALLVDPWNEIEHALNRKESMHEYTGRAIRAFKRFGREYGVLVIIVAHPTKGAASRVAAAQSRNEKDQITLYDISDSAHFSNKADWGVTIERVVVNGVYSSLTNVHVTKVRYQPETGIRGTTNIRFTNGTFSE